MHHSFLKFSTEDHRSRSIIILTNANILCLCLCNAWSANFAASIRTAGAMCQAGHPKTLQTPRWGMTPLCRRCVTLGLTECVFFSLRLREGAPFGNCFLSLERYLIIINYVAMGHRASSSAVKGLRLSHDLEKGKRKSLVCYNSSHLWVPSSPLEHLFFLLFFFNERVFVFQLDQRRSATDRRFDRSTNRTQSKGEKCFFGCVSWKTD